MLDTVTIYVTYGLSDHIKMEKCQLNFQKQHFIFIIPTSLVKTGHLWEGLCFSDNAEVVKIYKNIYGLLPVKCIAAPQCAS